MTSLDRKISNLETEFSERRNRAMQALQALHGGAVPTVNVEIKEQEAVPSAAQEGEAKEHGATPSAVPRYKCS